MRHARQTAAAALLTAFITFIVAGTWASAANSAQLTGPLAIEGLSKRDRIQKVNDGTVGIISGGIGGTYIRMATDMSTVLDGEDLRVLPISGKGSIQNIIDLLYLRGVDIAIVQSDVLSYIRNQSGYGKLADKIQYVTKLHNEEFHLLTRKEIASVGDLKDKKVNFGGAGSGGHMTASVVFEALGIPVQATTFDNQAALQKLKSGEIDAMAFVAGKPAPLFSEIPAEDGLKLLDIDYTPSLQKTYLPARLTSNDYAGLIAPGEGVDTISLGAVMAVFNWRKGTGRYYRVHRFIQSFFDRFDEFQAGPRHPKWAEVNLNAELPGWTRYVTAREWLDKAAKKRAAHSGKKKQVKKLREAFKTFLQTSSDARALSSEDQNELFSRFMKWRESSN